MKMKPGCKQTNNSNCSNKSCNSGSIIYSFWAPPIPTSRIGTLMGKEFFAQHDDVDINNRIRIAKLTRSMFVSLA
jgi:hypothetical protein